VSLSKSTDNATCLNALGALSSIALVDAHVQIMVQTSISETVVKLSSQDRYADIVVVF